MNSLKNGIKSISVTILLIAGCGYEESTAIKTELRFLYEDCLTPPIEHTTGIPADISNLKVTLIKGDKITLERVIKNAKDSSMLIIDGIEPYDNYKLRIEAITKDNIRWSGFAEGVEIRPKSKTFVQINLTKEMALTCTTQLKTKRFMHTSIKLKDGRVLIFGGVNSSNKEYDVYHINSTEMAEIFYPYKVEVADNVKLDVQSGSFYTLGSRMTSGRIGYIYEELPDGKILIAGGIDKGYLVKNPDDFFICLNDNTKFVKEIEIFDPTKDSFIKIGELSTSFAFAQSARIGNEIYIIGGISSGFDCNNPTSEGINSKIIIINISDINSPKISEKPLPEVIFFAGGKIQISESKFLFFGGPMEDGLMLGSDGNVTKVSFEVSKDFGTDIPQQQYFPETFPVVNGSLYLNIGGFYKLIKKGYYIRYISDRQIKIEPDNHTQEAIFGSSNVLIRNYLFQSGGIKSIPITISDMFSVRKFTLNDYNVLDSKSIGVEKLKRERAFHSSVKIEDNIFLITGGLYFDQSQEAVILGTAEIYNGYGLIDK